MKHTYSTWMQTHLHNSIRIAVRKIHGILIVFGRVRECKRPEGYRACAFVVDLGREVEDVL